MAENYTLIPNVAMYTQTEPLKESKDLSQNLVSGDFERQYRNRMLEKGGGRKRQACVVTFGVTVAVLVVWLLVLTVLRQVQITRLREEVEQLSAHIIAVEANLNALNHKISNNALFNEFKAIEDTIYADDDQGDGLKENVKGKQDYGSLDKLHKLTVLEDDAMPDDEDLAGDDDQYDESGDYYQDYDQRRANAKPGTTNMVLPTPEDFFDSVVKFSQDDKASLSKIRKIQRMLNENPENPDIALVAAAPTKPTSPPSERGKRSVIPESPLEMIDLNEKPEERHKTEKVPIHDSVIPVKAALHTVTRTARNSDNMGSSRPFIAAHFHGNTSHLSPEIHEHYKGNGLVRVAHDAAHNVWYPSGWTISSPHPRPTLTRNGHVHVHHSGIYLVYVQIYYLDSHDVIAWVLHRTNADTEGRETLMQCAQSSHSLERLDKPNSCFSAAALYLRAGDRLAVRNTGGDRHSLMEPEKSFIGLIKLADTVDPDAEL
ncbi:hypothetical protein ACJJTC_012681 [Scirpophaga incertulas]